MIRLMLLSVFLLLPFAVPVRTQTISNASYDITKHPRLQHTTQRTQASPTQPIKSKLLYDGYNINVLLRAQGRAHKLWNSIDTVANLPAALRYARPYLAEGDRLRRLDKTEEALESYRQAIRSDPIRNNINIPLLERSYLGYALVYAKIHASFKFPDHRQKAAQFFRQVLSLNSNNTPAKLALALNYSFMGEWEDASEWATKSMMENPDHPSVRYWLGWIYFHGLGDKESAISAYEDELRFTPNDESALVDLATLYLHNGQYAKALTRLQQAVRLDAKDTNAHWFLGITYLQMGNKPRARLVYQTLQQLHRDIAKEFATRL